MLLTQASVLKYSILPSFQILTQASVHKYSILPSFPHSDGIDKQQDGEKCCFNA